MPDRRRPTPSGRPDRGIPRRPGSPYHDGDRPAGFRSPGSDEEEGGFRRGRPGAGQGDDPGRSGPHRRGLRREDGAEGQRPGGFRPGGPGPRRGDGRGVREQPSGGGDERPRRGRPERDAGAPGDAGRRGQAPGPQTGRASRSHPPSGSASRRGHGQGPASGQPPAASSPNRFPPRYTGPSPRRPGTDARAAAPAPKIDAPMRLNRFLARAGVAARRKADEIIASGAVTVNGAVVSEMGATVQPGDVVAVYGKPVTHAAHLYLLLNKPDDVITTKEDERGRASVLDLVDVPEAEKAALFPVGRLDRHTTGVLLLTTDGELAHRLLHPSYGVAKYYRIRTVRKVEKQEIDALRAGVVLDDGPARPDQVGYVALPDEREIGMRLHEGRNRIVRRMMEAVGHEVVELERVRYADLTAAGVRRGKWRRLTPVEVQRLRRLVKL